MRVPSLSTAAACLLATAAFPLASAERILYTTSLSTCQDNSSFAAKLFDVTFTPDNGTINFNVNGDSTIQGNVTIDLTIYAYGYQAYTHNINPCDQKSFKGLCPMNEGPIKINSNYQLESADLSKVPSIAYTVPDLDATVKVFFNGSNGEALACVEASMSNGKTVYQEGVSWTTAVISGLALVSSAITSGLGHSNTAAHVAANALSLFGYFQAQAYIGMTAVYLPPIVAAWTQNFQWSMGIIRVQFIQDIATWYQRSTGGTPSTIISSLNQVSVLVQKRELVPFADVARRMAKVARSAMMVPRATTTSNEIIVRGIERVGFRAGIEPTNIFLTGYIFFLIFVVFTTIGVILFKLLCELLVKAGHLKGDKFQDFRNGWTTILKGILFRIVLIGFPQMAVLCFWEFTSEDSAAEVVLAVFTIFTMLALLGWASSKVIRMAQRSIVMHKNPAYVLYSDPAALNKWGFLYVQFKATAYYFIVPVLMYILVKSLFIAVAQNNGVVQAVALLIIEAAYLIGVAILRPYMDKRINGFNIAICSINFLSSIFVLVFSDVFNQPDIVSGVMGVIFFVYNAAFSTILLIMVLVAAVIAITSKNPDTRYQPMRDDRGSFIKTQGNTTTELDALAAVARGETKHPYTTNARIEDDDDSWSTEQPQQRPPYSHTEPPRSPVNGSAPGGLPDNASGRNMAPVYNRLETSSPGPRGTTPVNNNSQSRFRQQGPSPWQRGAGYD